MVLQEAVEALQRDGYQRLRGIYSRERMQEALDRVVEWDGRSKEATASNVPFLNVGQPLIYNLQNKDAFFLDLLFEPKLLQDILIHFLNDRWFKQIPQDEPNYTLRSLLARSSNQALPMHVDSFVPYLGSHVLMLQYSIILQDQCAENGCTVVVPRSHLSGEYTTQEATADAVPVESEVGDVVVWDSRLWHGTTANATADPRWAIVATFSRWWIKQAWDVPRSLPQEIYARLTDSQKAVLGFCSAPYADEMAGIDMKRGYDALPTHVRDVREGR